VIVSNSLNVSGVPIEEQPGESERLHRKTKIPSFSVSPSSAAGPCRLCAQQSNKAEAFGACRRHQCCSAAGGDEERAALHSSQT